MKRKLKLIACSVVVGSLLPGSGFGAADGNRELFPGFADSHTAALWLFDEPLTPHPDRPPKVSEWDYTRTLTDASENMYDLNRLDGARIVPGRFGRALSVSGNAVGPDLNLPANFAMVPKIGGILLGGIDNEEGRRLNLFLYTFTPRSLTRALEQDCWTWETWIRVLSPCKTNATLFDMGFGLEPEFSVLLLPQEKRFQLDSRTSGLQAKVETELEQLTDGQWHHVAFVRESNRIRHFIDGRPAGVPMEVSPSKRPAAETHLPGLAATIFRKPAYEGPVRTETIARLDSDWNTRDGEKFSARMRGWIKAPATGEITFSTEPDRALHLAIDGDPIIYGWIEHAERYRRAPREGTFWMEKGRVYPIRLDFHFNEAEPGGKPQRLYWRWKDQEKTPMPKSAFTHTESQQQAARQDRGSRSFAELMNYRFNLVLGSDRLGRNALDCELDEMRISDVARYAVGFKPVSHSFNYGSHAPKPSSGSDLPLLFEGIRKSTAGGQTTEPVALGARRHVFIDDVLVAEQNGVELKVNPPRDPQLANIGRIGDGVMVDKNGQVWAYLPDGYETQTGKIRVLTSKDGMHFTAPRLEQIPSDQPSDENLVMTGVSMWGRFGEDSNPNCPPAARYKATAFVPQRGIYGLLSPDGIHWRRNETAMLLVTSGGGSEWYYDDQRGVYSYLLKWDHGPTGRTAVAADTQDFYQPWPLQRANAESDGLLTPWGEMPVRFAPNANGQVYRTRALKYPWAPDTYVGFVWRFNRAANVRQTELAVSRDGRNWRSYTNQAYLSANFEFLGRKVLETLSADGFVRRGDQLWQWATFNTGTHDGGGTNYLARLTQRLDGFVSLNGVAAPYRVTTRAFTFSGRQLRLNITSTGSARVGIVNADGATIGGLALADCDSMTTDEVNHVVSWKGRKDVSALAGKPVRLQFELPAAQLYAFEFEQ